MRVRQIEKPAAVAGVAQLHGDAARGHALEDFVETGELEIGKRLVRFVGLREVRHHAFERAAIFRQQICSMSGNASSQRTPKRLMPV